ncbi:MAG: YjbH domain-containing protein [Bacteroidaceae bacterium]|nr:YjbH domain-containing protein [Bacteroidaceae bacterium]
MKRIALVTAFLFTLPFAGRAQQFLGTSGLLHVPSAEMHHEGDALLGIHYLDKHMTPDTGFMYLGEKYNTFDYYVSLAPFKWVEVSYVCVERAHSMSHGEITKWGKDRSASFKVRPLEEGRYWPALAIGCNDFATSVFKKNRTDVQLYFMNVYLAATKHFTFGGNELGVTVAYRHYLRGYNSKWNGLVGGITFRPAFFPQARVVAEYTGNEFLMGMDVLLWRHLRLQASVKDFKYVNAGLALQFNLLGQKYHY